MTKLIIKLFLFSTILLIILKRCDDRFTEKNEYFYSIEHYKNINKNIDIAFFGSSHSYRTYDPRVIESELGLNAYNFGSSSQHLIITRAVMDDVFRNNDVKLAVVDVFGLALQKISANNSKTRSFQLNALDNLDFSYSKLEVYNEVFGFNEFYNLSPTIRNHSNWERFFEIGNITISENEDFYNGFHTNFRFNKRRWEEGAKNTNRNKSKDVIIKELTNEEKAIIDRIILKTKEYNVPVIFVCAPFFNALGEKAKTYQRLVGDYLSNKQVKYIDYRTLWSELKLSKFDFKDYDHLNSKGALKVSMHLSDYIKENTEIIKSENDNVFLYNRYAIVKNKYKNVLVEEMKPNTLVRDSLGIERIYLFKTLNKRYEILIEAGKGKLKSLNACLEFTIEEENPKRLSSELREDLKNKTYNKCFWLSGPFDYNEKQYLNLQFTLELESLKDFKLFLENDLLVMDKKKLIINQEILLER